MTAPTDYSGACLGLALATGFYNPDPAVRQDFRTVLDRWLDSLHDTPDPATVRQSILSEGGTVIEPFLLDEADVDCAVFLVRAAFSAEIGETRVRIVSRDTIGRDGGLVFTPSLATYHVARYPNNECRGQPKGGWVFAPTAIPLAASLGPGVTTALLRTEEEGFRITVRLPECKSAPAEFARRLQVGSRIRGLKESFDRLGLRVECRKGEVHVLSGNPESMIRCMAHMADGSSMLLDGGSESPQIPRVLIRLEPPGGKAVPLNAIIGCTEEYISWFSGEMPVSLPLGEAHRDAIARWLRPSNDWMESINERIP
jgi:hypothetical protein